MNEVTVLNITNIALGIATLTLWVIIGRSIVQEIVERRRRAHAPRPHLHLVPPSKVA